MTDPTPDTQREALADVVGYLLALDFMEEVQDRPDPPPDAPPTSTPTPPLPDSRI